MTQTRLNLVRNKKPNNKKTKDTNTTLTRRKFLGKAAATASVFSIVPRHVLGGANFTSPSDVVRMAGIGCGSHAAFFFPE